jgi:hypothetical protein
VSFVGVRVALLSAAIIYGFATLPPFVSPSGDRWTPGRTPTQATREQQSRYACKRVDVEASENRPNLRRNRATDPTTDAGFAVVLSG